MRLAFPPRAAVLLSLLVIAWGPCPGSVVTSLRKAFPGHGATSTCCGCRDHAVRDAAPKDGDGSPCPCCDEQATRKNARAAEPVPCLPTPLLLGSVPADLDHPSRVAVRAADIAEDANGPPDGAPVGIVVLTV